VRLAKVPAGWRARCSVRDPAGRLRQIERTRTSKAAAENAVRAAAQRVSPELVQATVPGALSTASPLRDVVDVWWAEAAPRLRSQSRVTYRHVVDGHVLAPLGAARVSDLTVSLLDRHVKKVAADHPSTGYTLRSILGQVTDLLVRLDLLETSLGRQTAPVRRSKTRTLALTPAEARGMLDHLLTVTASDGTPLLERQAALVVATMLGTGMRISEVLGLRTADLALDDDPPTVTSTGIVVPNAEGGMLWQPAVKTGDEGDEIVRLVPRFAVDALRAAAALGLPGGENDLVFPSSQAGLRRPSAVRAIVSRLLTGTEWDGLRAHLFRKTVATTIAEITGDAQAAADQLDHASVSTTRRSYIKRRTVLPDRREELSTLAPSMPIATTS
jgi:integrase